MDLRVKHKSMRHLEIKENICDLVLGKQFLNLISKAWSVRGSTDKLQFIKIKRWLCENLC